MQKGLPNEYGRPPVIRRSLCTQFLAARNNARVGRNVPHLKCGSKNFLCASHPRIHCRPPIAQITADYKCVPLPHCLSLGFASKRLICYLIHEVNHRRRRYSTPGYGSAALSASVSVEELQVLGFKDLMANAANLQAKLADVQKDLAHRTVIGSAGGDMVQVEISGAMEVVSVKIEPTLIAEGDVEMLQDLVAAAANAAIARAGEMAAAEMSKLTGGLRLPGMV